MAIEKEIVDRLLADYQKPEDLTGENGVLRQLTKALMERALEAEMATHLGYERHAQEAKPNGNRRNGKSKKTLKGDFGTRPWRGGTHAHRIRRGRRSGSSAPLFSG